MKRIWVLFFPPGLWPVVQAADHHDTSRSFGMTPLPDSVSMLQKPVAFPLPQ